MGTVAWLGERVRRGKATSPVQIDGYVEHRTFDPRAHVITMKSSNTSHANPIIAMAVETSDSRSLDGHLKLYPLMGDQEAPAIVTLKESSIVYDVNWSCDNRYIFAGCSDAGLRVIDAETKTVMAICEGHASAIRSISPDTYDPNLLATGGMDRTIHTWDLRVNSKLSTRYTRSLPPTNRFTSSCNQTILGLGRKSGSHVLVSGGDHAGTITFWDSRGGGKGKRPLYMVDCAPGVSCGVVSLDVQPIGGYIAVACTNTKLFLVDSLRVEDGPVCTLGGAFAMTSHNNVRFNCTGETLAIGSTDGCVRMWHTYDALRAGADGVIVHPLEGKQWCPLEPSFIIGTHVEWTKHDPNCLIAYSQMCTTFQGIPGFCPYLTKRRRLAHGQQSRAHETPQPQQTSTFQRRAVQRTPSRTIQQTLDSFLTRTSQGGIGPK